MTYTSEPWKVTVTDITGAVYEYGQLTSPNAHQFAANIIRSPGITSVSVTESPKSVPELPKVGGP